MAQVPGVGGQTAQENPMVQMEALRRRAGLGASAAGIGADVTNSPSPSNPIPPNLQTNPAPAGGGAAGFPSDGAVGALKEQKSEAQTLGNALIFRLKKLTERGE